MELRKTTPSPCTTCTRGCCRRHTVNVGGYDAWAIARGLELSPLEFVVAVERDGPDAGGFLLAAGGPHHELALAKRPTGEAYEPCLFVLAMPDGSDRCGIYGLRPLVCRAYPAYTRSGLVGRRDDVLCPDEAWRDGALGAPGWYATLARHHVEHDIYELAVARWNYALIQCGPGATPTLAAYLAFVMAFYDGLEPLRAGVAPAAWSELCARWERQLDRGVSPLRRDCPELAPWAALLAAIRGLAGSFFAAVDDKLLADEYEAWETEQLIGGRDGR